jgi:WD40 repeat protein
MHRRRLSPIHARKEKRYLRLSLRERYLDLAVFPEDQLIPEGPLTILWRLDETDTRDCMTRLVARSLATRSRVGEYDALILHDLQRNLIRKRREKNLPSLHLRLVEAWDALPKVPDAYAWRWVGYHMAKAGRQEDLRQLLQNFNWLQAKLEAIDGNALIADYDYLADDEELRLIQSALRLSTHVLVHDGRKLAGQLIGRLLGHSSPGIQTLLKQASEKTAWPWFRPPAPSLIAPGGPLIRTLEGHTWPVNAVAVTPDGRRAVSGSWDQTLRLWDLESGEEIASFTGEDWMQSCAFTPDGQTIVAGDVSGVVHFLRLVEADETKLSIGDTKIQLLQRKEQTRSPSDS